MTPTESADVHAWRKIPVDDVGYIDGADLLAMPEPELRQLVQRMENTRYGGWRNYGGLWRETLGLDSTFGKRVLDYGCGVGVEALQYGRNGNVITVADVNPASVHLAMRVLRLHAIKPVGAFVTDGRFKYPGPNTKYDVIHCAGVLHHVRDPYPLMRDFHRALDPAGELRLMVYSDVGWRIACGTEPPEDVAADPLRETFVRYFDSVGDWADWYSPARLRDRFREWFRVDRITYITSDQRYLTATLWPRP